jgi:hypothetical protein
MRLYDQNWDLLAVKQKNSRDADQGFLSELSKQTRITQVVFQLSGALNLFSVAERLSWGARRRTTRPEDRAYSLMGLCDVNIPVLYGEGPFRAFRRLRLEIMANWNDESLFAWKGQNGLGILARSPSDFVHSGQVKRLVGDFLRQPYHITNIGVSMRMVLYDPDAKRTMASLNCSNRNPRVWIHLERVYSLDHPLPLYRRKEYNRLGYTQLLDPNLENPGWRRQRQRDIYVQDESHSRMWRL